MHWTVLQAVFTVATTEVLMRQSIVQYLEPSPNNIQRVGDSLACGASCSSTRQPSEHAQLPLIIQLCTHSHQLHHVA